MKKKIDLALLIQSLTKSEKRYFKLHTLRNTSAKSTVYIRLFDAIDKQKTYDEQELLDLFSGPTAGKNLSAAKRYLYESILQSQRLYHHNITPDIQMYTWLHSAEILYNKGLFDQCREMLDKAAAIATEGEDYTMRIKILKWQYRLILAQTQTVQNADAVHAIFDDMLQSSEWQRNHIQYWSLQSKVYMSLLNIGLPRSLEMLTPLRAILDDPLLRDERYAQGPFAKIMFFNIHSLYHRLTGDLHKALNFELQALRVFRNAPNLQSNVIDMYIPALYNVCQRALDAYEFDVYDEVYPELMRIYRDARNRNPHYRNITPLMCRVRESILRGEYARAVQQAQELAPELVDLDKGRIGTDSFVSYLLFMAYFGSEDYSTALNYLNRLIHQSNDNFASGLNYLGKVFTLIVHFELGNTEQLEYFLISAYRSLAKQQRFFALESVLFRFLRKLPAVYSEEELIAEFRSIGKELLVLQRDPFHALVFYYFDFFAWLIAKIHRRSFADTVRNGLRARLSGDYTAYLAKEFDAPHR